VEYLSINVIARGDSQQQRAQWRIYIKEQLKVAWKAHRTTVMDGSLEGIYEGVPGDYIDIPSERLTDGCNGGISEAEGAAEGCLECPIKGVLEDSIKGSPKGALKSPIVGNLKHHCQLNATYSKLFEGNCLSQDVSRAVVFWFVEVPSALSGTP